MAFYTTIQAVTSLIPAEIVQQLTDDANINELGVDNVNYCITLASDMIDGYLMGHYPLPLTVATPPLIIDIATRLSVYFLFQRSLILTMPEPLEKNYDWALATLRNIQKAIINPFPVAQNPFYAKGGNSAQAGGRVWNRISRGGDAYYVGPGDGPAPL